MSKNTKPQIEYFVTDLEGSTHGPFDTIEEAKQEAGDNGYEYAQIYQGFAILEGQETQDIQWKPIN